MLADRSCSVVAGVSHGAVATAAKRDRRTVGSPANVRGSAISTDRLRVPGRSPSRAIESARNRWDNLAFITPRDEIKFVLASRADYEWMRDVIAVRVLAARTANLLASTVFGALATRDLVAWVLEDALPVRVQLQMHKYVWAPDATGV